MQCEMYWGFENAKPCTNEATSKFTVRLAGGGKRRIAMCEKCQHKYFGKVMPPNKASTRLAAGVANFKQCYQCRKQVTQTIKN